MIRLIIDTLQGVLEFWLDLVFNIGVTFIVVIIIGFIGMFIEGFRE